MYLQSVQNGGFASTIESEDQDPHLLFTPQLVEHREKTPYEQHKDADKMSLAQFMK